MQAEWINLDKFNFRETLRHTGIWPARRIIYSVHSNGLMFKDANGVLYSTHDADGYSDGGTIPWPFCLWMRRTEYMESYWFHDQGCQFGGFWENVETKQGIKRQKWVEFDRPYLDKMLERMIEASPNDRKIKSELLSLIHI